MCATINHELFAILPVQRNGKTIKVTTFHMVNRRSRSLTWQTGEASSLNWQNGKKLVTDAGEKGMQYVDDGVRRAR